MKLAGGDDLNITLFHELILSVDLVLRCAVDGTSLMGARISAAIALHITFYLHLTTMSNDKRSFVNINFK